MNQTKPTPLVWMENLKKTYQSGQGSVQALKSASLKVFSGESLAIMGPSGSGKSTLLHLLGCLDRPSAGMYKLNNQDVSTFNDIELSLLRAQQIGFVFQFHNLIPHLNVYENVEIPFLYRSEKLSESETKNRVTAAIDRVGISHRSLHLPSQLSGGELQRAAIARALVVEPLMILADEPTGNLDSQTGKSILTLFQELNTQGSTLVIVTHDHEVAKHCKRVINVQDGVVYEGNSKVFAFPSA